jgi:hypothetical protein
MKIAPANDLGRKWKKSLLQRNPAQMTSANDDSHCSTAGKVGVMDTDLTDRTEGFSYWCWS